MAERTEKTDGSVLSALSVFSVLYFTLTIM
jgi:hypothetical protein